MLRYFKSDPKELAAPARWATEQAVREGRLYVKTPLSGDRGGVLVLPFSSWEALLLTTDGQDEAHAFIYYPSDQTGLLTPYDATPPELEEVEGPDEEDAPASAPAQPSLF